MTFADARRLPLRYWLCRHAGGAVFTLARFSEAFLVLRARGCRPPRGAQHVPVVMIVMNVLYAGGRLSGSAKPDHDGPRQPPDAVVHRAGSCYSPLTSRLAFATSPLTIFAGVALWGLHLGLTQGVLAALVAISAPKRLRGTAFGLFGLVTGVFTLLASVLAGWLWVKIGEGATFATGAGFAAIALLAFLFLKEPTENRG